MKPPLRWFGAKVLQSKRIVGIMPAHDIYCEPFLGSGAVFFAKEPARASMLSDIDFEVVNVHRAIKHQPENLHRLVPDKVDKRRWGDEVAIASRFCGHPNLVHKGNLSLAIATIIKYCASFQAIGQVYSDQCGMGFEHGGSSRRPKTLIAKERLLPASSMLSQNVSIDLVDAIDRIFAIDGPDALFYLDPPYLFGDGGSRTSGDRYQHESTPEYLKQMTEILPDVQGKVILSTDSGDYWNSALPNSWNELAAYRKSRGAGKGHAEHRLFTNFPVSRKEK